MDQTRYWMFARRKSSQRPFLSPGITRVAVGSSYSESWEEQAFAEDSAGHLGGCIWPPRSYTCSFCRREFRSAQALGGHMNVHRRDRARLKEASATPSDETHDHGVDQNHHVNPCTSQATPYAPQILTIPGLRDGRDDNSKIGDVRCRLQRDSGDDDDEITCSKRRRIDTILPFYVKSSSSNRQQHEQQQPPGVLKLCPSSIEELDLELRLGDPPKVK